MFRGFPTQNHTHDQGFLAKKRPVLEAHPCIPNMCECHPPGTLILVVLGERTLTYFEYWLRDNRDAETETQIIVLIMLTNCSNSAMLGDKIHYYTIFDKWQQVVVQGVWDLYYISMGDIRHFESFQKYNANCENEDCKKKKKIQLIQMMNGRY